MVHAHRPAVDSIDEEVSSIELTLDAIGDRWTLLILRDVFRGVRRFEQLQRDLGIARNMLTDRLNRLIDVGVLVKEAYQDRPVRYEYRLTDKGRDLSPSLIALMRWGDHWYRNDRPPTVLIHEQCGHELDQQVTCPECHVEVPPTDIRSRPGPGHAAAV